jgi:hypothetical protein
MTGQVKEEILTRFGELGARVADGEVRFETSLLRPTEFRTEPGAMRWLDVEGEWQELSVEAGSLAFTWCQVPFVYSLRGDEAHVLRVQLGAEQRTLEQPLLAGDLATELFSRTGRIRRVDLFVDSDRLFRG